VRLLVANRAEIAVRIMSTAAVLGIETVAVHPDDDAACAHVARASAAVRLPGAGPAAYLDAGAIAGAATTSGCDTLHPGYGFLAENSDLARRCAAAGIRFAGPAPEVLDLFGDKTAARARAAGLGIPLARATDGPAGPAEARAFLDSLGPGAAVMVKAVAGGGGRGLRPVAGPAGLDEALRRSASEAAAAFGDPAVYVEELLTGARHVEVQLIGDGTRVAVLGDRDCSLQRRRQKLIEIAPADLGDNLRARLHEAAYRLIGSTAYTGLATAEFLVTGDRFVFLEVNPRIQVEHTVTEEVTGLDLVELMLRITGGETLADLGLADVGRADLHRAGLPRPARGCAIEARVNTEIRQPDGTMLPASGTLTRFQPPAGHGVRVDTHGYPGYAVSPRYDPLLAKVIATGADRRSAAARLRRALNEFGLAGVPGNLDLLSALAGHLEDEDLDTTWVDRHPGLLPTATTAPPESAPTPAAAPAPSPSTSRSRSTPSRPPSPSTPSPSLSAAAPPPAAPADRNETAVRAPLHGTVVAVTVRPGDEVAPGREILVLEAMKMEHVVAAPGAGIVTSLAVQAGDTVAVGTLLATLDPRDHDGPGGPGPETADPGRIRPDLDETIRRHHIGSDAYRRAATARRHQEGRRTARENVADLVDDGTFVEYGALVIAAQRRRRPLEDLIERTPADGLLTGTAAVGGRPVAVMSYDYTVLAGTQGIQNHRKTDRLLELARRERLPVVIFAEGGGGRPGDTDTAAVAQLDVPTFRLLAELSGQVPLVAVVSGYCFAGNAALAGACDVIIATEGSSLGMGGPAMIEGGGLGVVAPADVGPMSVQVPNGVVDVLVPGDAAAVAAARAYLGYVAGPGRPPAPSQQGPPAQGAPAPSPAAQSPAVHGPRAQSPAAGPADQRELRHLMPENRVRAYDVRPVVQTLFDRGSVLELRPQFGVGIITALARLDGHPVGVLANNPRHLGGAIDGDAADKATRFLQLCQAHGIAVVSLCDTPGFMVGPEAERTATVRRFGAMFIAGARLTVPLCTVVLRKGYGLGAMAMAGGDLKAPLLCVAWPTGEFGGMGLEGAVRLGFRKELAAITDPAGRQQRYEQLVAEYYEKGKALSTAAAFEIDDVIDPAQTRHVLIETLARTRS
jgi:acetyl/propionyl-CoA carboxylase alpha subunit/acetyl-CoA carboxylase carboxyltransferase component